MNANAHSRPVSPVKPFYIPLSRQRFLKAIAKASAAFTVPGFLAEALAVTPDESMVSVPVIATNAVNGMLAVVRGRPLDADEEWQLSAIADQAAIALQNARLFEIESAEAKRLRDATEIARRHLASIVESSDDAIISKNLDGIIQSWNEAASRVFGYSADEVIGRHITMLLPKDRLNEETLIIEIFGATG